MSKIDVQSVVNHAFASGSVDSNTAQSIGRAGSHYISRAEAKLVRSLVDAVKDGKVTATSQADVDAIERFAKPSPITARLKEAARAAAQLTFLPFNLIHRMAKDKGHGSPATFAAGVTINALTLPLTVVTGTAVGAYELFHD